MTSTARRSIALAFVCTCINFSSFAQTGPNFTSIENEIALGRQLAEEVERNITLLKDPAVGEYVNRLGQNLALKSGSPIPMTFRVVDTTDVNAFSLPGFVYLNSGVVIAAESEAELAAVIAHQIAHIARRHATQLDGKAQLVNFASLPLILSSGHSICSYRDSGARTLTPFTAHIRTTVTDADDFGVRYLYDAGYDVNAAIRFLEKVQGMPANPSEHSMHPAVNERIAALRSRIAAMPASGRTIVNTPEFGRIKARLRQIQGIRGVVVRSSK